MHDRRLYQAAAVLQEALTLARKKIESRRGAFGQSAARSAEELLGRAARRLVRLKKASRRRWTARESQLIALICRDIATAILVED